MAASFYFYDLETSGISPRQARIMQFAGQRTDLSLKPIGEPTNIMIKLTPDILPEPEAILLTGITPQQTLTEGVTEAAFLELFYESIVLPDTIFVGFNNIRFDDEFIRFLNYRNFYDAYEWAWAHGCSRWDLLDVLRMARALRPEGIDWPFTDDGKPTNRLELLTKLNKLDHINAHDALSDVQATIAVAGLLKNKQPELYSYLFDMRDKKKIARLVTSLEPFVYTTSHYSSRELHTSVAVLLVDHPKHDAAIVYDLRHDPTPFFSMSVDQLVEAWKYTKDPEVLRLPLKTLKYNRNPAVAPLGVIKQPEVQERLNLSLDTITKHWQLLKAQPQSFAANILKAIDRLDEQQLINQRTQNNDLLTIDGRLYENFISAADKKLMLELVRAKPADFARIGTKFQDERLRMLLPLYKARNYPETLDPEEQVIWNEYRAQRLFQGGQESPLALYFARLQQLAAGKLSSDKEFLLEELQLYGQSLLPAEMS